MSHTTPPQINGRIRVLRDLIAPGSEIVRLPLRGDMKAKGCFPNVKARIDKEGGELVIGWCVWQASKFIEAEYHAVWKKDGELIDLTTKPSGETEIVYFADPAATYIPVEVQPGIFKTRRNRILPNGESRLFMIANGKLVPLKVAKDIDL